MKIYTFTDIHSNMKLLNKVIANARKKEVDFIVTQGDLSFFNQDLDKVLKKLKCEIPVIAIPGNHEDEEEMRELCGKLGIIYLHKATFEINDYVFIGYGNDGFGLEDDELERFIKKVNLKNKKVITLSHGPPYGTALDYIPRLGFVGCKSVNKMIKKFKPILHLCGHIHETFGLKDKIGNTVIVNPGPLGRVIEL